MRISREEWNALTCRQIYALMHKYNEEAKADEAKFFFVSGGLFNGRLAKGTNGQPSITFAVTRETLDSDNLVVDTIRANQLLKMSLLTPEEQGVA